MLAAAFLMLVAAADQPLVVATFTTTATNPDNMVAEQIKKPDDVSAEVFADRLVKAEGITSWGLADPVTSAMGALLTYKARHAGNGREVAVYYSPAAQTVCRIRRQRGGLSTVHQAAIRWCAASLGIMLPDEPAPVAGTNLRP